MSNAVTTSTIDVLLLGTFHMGNPGRDLINLEVDDVLTPERQAELEALAQRLATFEPTKVCVEWHDQPQVDAAYDAYRDGAAQEQRGEIHQVAFRVAHLCGHARCYAIDDDTPMRWEGFEEYLALNPADAARYEADIERVQAEAKEDSQRLQRGSIGSFLRGMNEGAALRQNLAFYIDVLAWRGDGARAIADLAASWYERNIRVFANLARLTEPGDRAFVLFGSGHIPILRHLVDTSTSHRLVDVLTYLA